MKIEYVYTCCRCGKEFRNSTKLFGTAKVNVVKYEDYVNKLNYSYEEICPECFRELKWWLKGNSTSIDEIKRLHDDIDELNKRIDIQKNMLTDRDTEILKLKGEIISLNDRCDWFLEEVDTPHGKCIKSKDWKVVEKAAEIIKEYMKSTEKYDFDFKDVLECNKKAEKFLEDYNLNKEKKSND